RPTTARSHIFQTKPSSLARSGRTPDEFPGSADGCSPSSPANSASARSQRCDTYAACHAEQKPRHQLWPQLPSRPPECSAFLPARTTLRHLCDEGPAAQSIAEDPTARRHPSILRLQIDRRESQEHFRPTMGQGSTHSCSLPPIRKTIATPPGPTSPAWSKMH